MTVVVITGASSGLGREYVRQVIKQVPSVEEIWLVARRADILEKIASEYPKQIFRLLPLDLTNATDLDAYRATLRETQAEVSLLINCAGCGKLGTFAEEEVDTQLRMVDLNCRALTAVTNLTLPYMGKGSGVLNVSSIASYVPTPNMAVYSATKAYVTAFSHAIAEELLPRGIRVLCTCPGPMATEFLDIAAISGNSKTFQRLPYCRPEMVAEQSLRRLLRGKRWYTPRIPYKFMRLLAKILPIRIALKLSKV